MAIYVFFAVMVAGVLVWGLLYDWNARLKAKREAEWRAEKQRERAQQ